MEEAIVECLRGNESLCAERVPARLFRAFGSLLNSEPDPSGSDLLDFFAVACVPCPAQSAVLRNQVCL